MLDGHGLDDLADTAEPLASGMVTNAYRHTGGPSSMRLRGLPEGRLRITVWDTDVTIPPPFDKPPCPGADVVEAEAENGRGLHLVRLWADNWGSCLLGDASRPTASRSSPLSRTAGRRSPRTGASGRSRTRANSPTRGSAD